MVYNINQAHHYNYRNGVATIPASDITTMILKNPNQPTECDDRTKQDFECLMADQISGDVYLVQKNVFGTDVSLYKVSVRFQRLIWLYYLQNLSMLISQNQTVFSLDQLLAPKL